MAGITLAQAESKLSLWLDAEAKLASAQSYEIDTGNGRRKLTRADLSEVRNSVEFWDRKVRELTPASAGGKRRVSYLVPGDG